MRRKLKRIFTFLIGLLIAAAVSIVAWAQWSMVAIDRGITEFPTVELAPSKSVPAHRAPSDGRPKPDPAAEPSRMADFIDRKRNLEDRSKPAAAAEHPQVAHFADRHRKLDAPARSASAAARAGGERGLAPATDLRIRPAEGPADELLGGIEAAPAPARAPRPPTKEAPAKEASAKEHSTGKSPTNGASTKNTNERVASLPRESPQQRSARASERVAAVDERQPAAAKRQKTDRTRTASNHRLEAVQRDPLRSFLRRFGL